MPKKLGSDAVEGRETFSTVRATVTVTESPPLEETRIDPSYSPPASVTTWNDSNSFFAAKIVASPGPVGRSVGRILMAGPRTTTVAVAARAGAAMRDAATADARRMPMGARFTLDCDIEEPPACIE